MKIKSKTIVKTKSGDEFVSYGVEKKDVDILIQWFANAHAVGSTPVTTLSSGGKTFTIAYDEISCIFSEEYDIE